MLPGDIAYMIDTIRETLIKNLEIQCRVVRACDVDHYFEVQLLCEGDLIDSDTVKLSDLKEMT